MAKYKVLKKLGDFKKGDILNSEESDFTEEEIASAVEAGQLKLIEENNEGADSKGQVTFHVRNKNVSAGHSTRVFSHAEHGAEYKSLADEFEQSNKEHILSRE